MHPRKKGIWRQGGMHLNKMAVGHVIKDITRIVQILGLHHPEPSVLIARNPRLLGTKMQLLLFLHAQMPQLPLFFCGL